MTSRILFGVILAGAISFAHADHLSTLSKQLLDVTGQKDIFIATRDQLFAYHDNQIVTNSTIQENIKTSTLKIHSRLKEHMSWEDVEVPLAVAYSQVFTESELRELITYYNSPPDNIQPSTLPRLKLEYEAVVRKLVMDRISSAYTNIQLDEVTIIVVKPIDLSAMFPTEPEETTPQPSDCGENQPDVDSPYFPEYLDILEEGALYLIESIKANSLPTISPEYATNQISINWPDTIRIDYPIEIKMCLHVSDENLPVFCLRKETELSQWEIIDCSPGAEMQ